MRSGGAVAPRRFSDIGFWILDVGRAARMYPRPTGWMSDEKLRDIYNYLFQDIYNYLFLTY